MKDLLILNKSVHVRRHGWGGGTERGGTEGENPWADSALTAEPKAGLGP